jgi:chromosome segregation ATPase
VDPDNLKEVSRQGQVWIYDAENEIVVALDKLDEAKDIMAKTKRRIKEAERSVELAEKRNNRLGVEVAEAWLAYLEALEEWSEENIELMRLGVVVARATVELAKAQVINREDLLGGKGFDMGDYKEQYTSLKDEFDTEHKRVKKLRKRARRRNKKWWTLRRRFVAQTGDYDSGLWID